MLDEMMIKANENPRNFNANDIVNILGTNITFPNNFSIKCNDLKDWEGNNTISDNAGCFVVSIGGKQTFYKYFKENGKIHDVQFLSLIYYFLLSIR